MAAKDYISEERMSEYDALIKQHISTEIGNIETFKQVVVSELPAIGESKTLYLVPIQSGSGNQYSEEYVWVEAQGTEGQSGYIPAHFEKVGSTDYTPDIAIEDKPSLNKLLVTLNPFNLQTKSQFLVARDPYDTPDAPTFDPVSGSSGNGSLTVALSCASSNVDIKYSLDNGATWTTGTSVTLSQDVNQESKSYTLKAKAVNKTSLLESDVVSATYTVKRKVATPSISPNAGTKNNIISVTMSCTTTGAVIYYTLDGSTPVPSEADQTGKATKQYTSAFSVASNTTVKAMACHFDNNVEDWVASSVASREYSFAVGALTIAADDTEEYKSLRTITISTDTSNATIKYTDDGSDPASSGTAKNYSSAISLSADDTTTTTIKARATYSDWTAATETASFTYGRLKTYFGASAKSALTSISDIQGLLINGATTGNSKKFASASAVKGTFAMPLTSEQQATGMYLWVCVPTSLGKTLNSDNVKAGGFGVSLNKITVGKYDCYVYASQGQPAKSALATNTWVIE